MDMRLYRFNLAALPLALAYFATGRLGLMLPAFGSSITLIWLPTGIATAALLRWGFGCWPGIALGAFAVNFALGMGWPTALGMAVGNTLGPVLAAWGLRRLDFHPAFDRARDIVVLAAAAAVGMLVPPSLGVLMLAAAGWLPDERLQAWLTWWGGDSLGVIAAAPLVLTFTRIEARAILRRRVEFLGWIGATAVATWGVFVFNPGPLGNPLALAFIPLPFVAWAALRFGAVGTSLGVILVSAGAAYGTATLRGPFFRANAVEEVSVLWLYMATSATLGWLISALNAARRQASGSQRIFEQALSDVSLGVLLAGLDRRITYANHGFTRLTGYTEAELRGKDCALLQGSETDRQTVSRLRTALHGDGFFDGEILNYRKNGTPFWNALLISPVRDDHGVMTGFLGIQRDVTQRKQAELALHQSEEHLRTIVDLDPDCVKILSPDGSLLEMNPAGLAMIEASSVEEVRGRQMGELIVAADRAAFAEMHRRVLRGASGRCEFDIVGLKGTRRSLETHAVPYRDARREIIGVLGITRDITERREAAAAVQRSLATLQLFIDTVPAYISFVDAGERYRLVNKRYEEYFGLPAERIIGQRICDIQPPAAYAEMRPHVRAALAGETVRFQTNPTRPGGDSHWFDVQYVPRRGEDGAVSGFFVVVFDITENKHAELALQKSETRFRKMFESNPHPMWVHDFETFRFLAVNDAAVEKYGYSREEFLSMTAMELRPPSQIQLMLAEAREVAAGKHHIGVWKHRTRDGTVIDVEISAHTIDFEGQLSAVVLAQDISERRRSETRVAGERAVLELLASNAPLAAVLDCLARTCEKVFPGMLCSVLLLDREGKRLWHGAAPSLPAAFCEAIDGGAIGPAVGSCGTAAYTRRTVLVSDIANDPLWKDYRDLALEHGLRACWSVPVISSQDRVLGTLALYYQEPASPRPEEISAIERSAHFACLAIERHELMRSLQESKVRLETLVSHLPGMAYRSQNDQSWTITYVSDGCEALTGYRPDELENNRLATFRDLIQPEDREWLRASCQAALHARKICQNEFRLIDKSGQERWVSERASGVHAADGTVLFIDGFVQDITAARQAKLEREKLDRKMQETQKLESLGVLAGGIAHDFNNLLTSILGNASIAALELPPGSSVQDCLEHINEASLRAADLCKQMLAYSGRGRFVVQKLDLGQLVEQTAQMLQISISKKAILRFRLENGLPPVEVDATQIRQVIMNLVINASEAIGDRSGVISLSTGLTRVDRAYFGGTLMDADLPEGDYVYLEVSDTGCGMSAETQAKIFDPFFTTKFTGRGLGLAAVLGIVRGHKGAMKVYSEVGRGTTFKLLFPAVSGAGETMAATSAPLFDWRGHGTVLVVDDEETMRSTIARMMRKLGLDAVLTADGREAVEVFRATPELFAVVLLDLTMPHMDGEQTFTELRRLRPGVRVVLMSGFNAQEALVRFTGKGLASFLQKPFTIESLSTTLRAALSTNAPEPPPHQT